MDSAIAPLLLFAAVLVLGATAVNLIVLRANSSPEVSGTKYIEEIQSTRAKGLMFLLLVLVLTSIYYFLCTQNYLEGSPPNFLKVIRMDSHSLKMLELCTRNIQKSFMFYATALVIPLVSSRRFRVLGVDEKVSIAFVRYYSLFGSFLYPFIFHVSNGYDLGGYLVEVLNIAENSLLLLLYFALLQKIWKMHDVLSYTQIITKFEIEEVLGRVSPKIVGIMAYLCADMASGAFRMARMFFPVEYGLGIPTNSLAETAFFVGLCYYSIKFLVTPGNGICESIQKMEGIKKHVASGFLNLEHRSGDDMMDVSTIPNI
ncbi:uncharacterized protein Eint_081140 [Encephalitozoon intestinalis ATCC 50506]|uniref:Uncharacterized protein n=1 Tax=Encephalitozoon intestinalis (strain ATCC 50506) TaxID=876142 RepID=E0S8S9_ENCIT|nr:uncharacterized protein Eint_081140 [Encephalitozoon intestinalis ATCC 50506]ADM12046.1 hypothetical protein Eint_081140 [Encephalitozoon intestinalis ATCC 50506]UTX45835.1 hypothetical protein GPK93_08g14140 [Encephalitozoon intestinalis]